MASGDESRVQRLAAWSEPVLRVRFVDGKRAGLLQRLGVSTAGDLLRHYPHRYLDIAAAPSLLDVRVGEDATAVGRVHEVKSKRPRKGLSITEVAIVDGTGVLLGVWFNQPFMAERFAVGERVAFAGRVTLDYGLKQIRNPLVERLGEGQDTELLGGLVPMHSTTEGLSANWLRRLVREALEEYGDVVDPLPAQVRQDRGLVSLAAALRSIHFPASAADAEQARRRLAYEEFFYLQLLLLGRRAQARDHGGGIVHVTTGTSQSAVRSALSFDLTADQEDALADILADMAAPSPMDRLLLGDVGTGKTAVAALALAASVDGGHQAAMMAPTEVLAHQYADRVGGALDSAGISWALLTGSTTTAVRREILKRVADGSTKILFGTHALFSEDVRFHDLGLVIVDEQHRFGVNQRLALRAKGPRSDLLVMSATPIPRSLALTVFGDLETSYLRERPTSKDPSEAVRSRVVHHSERHAAYESVRQAAAQGRQAYVICPLVDETAEADAKAATEESERIAADVFPELRVGLLTGRLASAEKIETMEAFKRGEIDVLVATTVVEVGVDVPNATVMIVEDAERFGLAQLHQLRGRVGRGESQGEFLVFADPTTDEGVRRMAAIESIADGFQLAEMDLGLRGEGDILGERQSGATGLLAASVLRDSALLEQARDDVAMLLDAHRFDQTEADALLAPARWMATQRFPHTAQEMTRAG